MARPDPLPNALLIVGPTGSGKTPLGQHLQANGLEGRPCIHFDFGARLRAVAAGEIRPAGLTEAEIRTVEEVLKAGKLLEDRAFPIARAILEDFLAREVEPGTLVVLNGLPRHLGQARDVSDLLDVSTVLYLQASPEVVQARIRENAGGDRGGREDDQPHAIGMRLSRFAEETLPLVEHYREGGARIVMLDVGLNTGPDELAGRLEGGD
jgi:adenylate kinase family enzyme